jgi:hypothetical protein
MVVVLVGEDDALDAAYPGTQHLLAEVRAGIHHHIFAAAGKERAGPQPLVPRVRTFADRAVTGDYGNTLAGAGAEES